MDCNLSLAMPHEGLKLSIVLKLLTTKFLETYVHMDVLVILPLQMKTKINQNTLSLNVLNFIEYELGMNFSVQKVVQQSGLFPDKSGATVFNNKIELFEKAEGQGPESFMLLGFRFLGYERPPETLK